MAKENFLSKVFHLYYDGFRSMTLGKTLWVIILIKWFTLFVGLKLFVFPNFLTQHADGGEPSYVAKQLLEEVEH